VANFLQKQIWAKLPLTKSKPGLVGPRRRTYAMNGIPPSRKMRQAIEELLQGWEGAGHPLDDFDMLGARYMLQVALEREATVQALQGGNKIFAGLLSFYSGKRTTDTSRGLRVFNVRLLPTVELLPDGLDFDTAMTTIALFEGLSYAEIPVNTMTARARAN